MAEFRMPSLGADMEAGTLVRWLVAPGDRVKRGDFIAEVETQKGVIDVEIFEDGTVTEFLVEEGAHVPVGTPLARIKPVGLAAAPSQPAPQAAPAPMPEPALAVTASTPSMPAPTVPAQPDATPAPATSDRQRIRATPVARKRAEELGVDLTSVTGSGPGGAIVLVDVEQAAKSQPAQAETPAEPKLAIPTPLGEEPARPAAPPSGMQAAIAAAMERSKREIPHYYLATDIDMRRALEWLADENSRRSVPARMLPAALLLRAVALACKTVPEMNGFWQDGAFVGQDHVHLGVAIALRGGGLVNPAILSADRISLDELMDKLRDLVARARGGKLRASEIAGGTITVTNLGDLGVRSVFGVIYPPQVALVGFGRITERPWATDGMLGVRPVVTATLSADHRASVGHRGGVFLSRIDALLQDPETLR